MAGSEGQSLGHGVFPMKVVSDLEDNKWMEECFICLQLLYEAPPDSSTEDHGKTATPENESCLKHSSNIHLACFEKWIRSQVNISGGNPPSHYHCINFDLYLL